MKAGAAEKVITPPVGCPLVGPSQPSTGVHDPLYARALVVDDGREPWIIVCLDLIGLDFALNDELRTLIREATGINTVLINCIHTHSAPFSAPWLVPMWKRHCRDEAEWRDSLRVTIPALAKEAMAKAVPVSLRVGRAPVQVGFNRRLMKDGNIVMEPNEDGPVVPWVDVLVAVDAQDRPTAALFSHAAHPVIVHGASTLISADYPGHAVTRIKKELGPDVIAMFAQGCGANINGHPLASGHDNAEEAGNKLGTAVIEAIANGTALEAPSFRCAAETVMLPCQELPSLELCDKLIRETGERLAKEKTEKKDTWYLDDKLKALTAIRRRTAEQHPAHVRLELNAVTCGSQWVLAALSHEMFCDYQLWIDETAPFDSTMALGYTNGCESYVPTDADLELREKGGYEAANFPASGAAFCYPGRLALRPGIEGLIKDAVRRMWESLK